MKRRLSILSVILAIIMCFSALTVLSACGDNTNENGQNQQETPIDGDQTPNGDGSGNGNTDGTPSGDNTGSGDQTPTTPTISREEQLFNIYKNLTSPCDFTKDFTVKSTNETYYATDAETRTFSDVPDESYVDEYTYNHTTNDFVYLENLRYDEKNTNNLTYVTNVDDDRVSYRETIEMGESTTFYRETVDDTYHKDLFNDHISLNENDAIKDLTFAQAMEFAKNEFLTELKSELGIQEVNITASITEDNGVYTMTTILSSENATTGVYVSQSSVTVFTDNVMKSTSGVTIISRIADGNLVCFKVFNEIIITENYDNTLLTKVNFNASKFTDPLNKKNGAVYVYLGDYTYEYLDSAWGETFTLNDVKDNNDLFFGFENATIDGLYYDEECTQLVPTTDYIYKAYDRELYTKLKPDTGYVIVEFKQMINLTLINYIQTDSSILVIPAGTQSIPTTIDEFATIIDSDYMKNNPDFSNYKASYLGQPVTDPENSYELESGKYYVVDVTYDYSGENN